jgi:hypothetical protein
MKHTDNNYPSDNLFAKLESNGFKVKGKYICKKDSKRNNLLKVVGHINEKNFFFHSANVYPFKAGTNYFNENTFGKNKEKFKKYYTKVTENQRNDFNVSYADYIKTTKASSIFSEWLNKTKREQVNSLSKNYFDIRGIVSGYLENAAVFPIFDFDNNFITAQIIKYGSNGKRIKSGFSENWYHSYKPIKADLGFKHTDVFSVSVPYFFGENQLNGSDNIVAIVEAPKTAVILKEIYPNIDWIATCGELHLFGKNLDLLKDRNVILFPDAHTTAWAKFAKEQGFYCSDILETEKVDSGSDLADYIFDSESEVYSEIHELLFSLNVGEFDFTINADSLILDYKVSGDDRSYFIAVPIYYKGNKVINQLDNSSDFTKSFKGNKFDLYTEKYEIYLSQIDWHRQTLKDGVLRPPTEKEFIFNLQQCFRILKELNPKIYKGVFNEVVKKLRYSNFSFNEKYILQRLVPFWDNWNRDLQVFKKLRNWKYKGGESLTREEFVSELNNHRFQYKFKLRVENLYDILSENRFIDVETDLGIYKEHGYNKIRNLIKDWNENVIGCRTLKSYLKKVDFIDKIMLGTKNDTLHIKNTIYTVSDFVPNLKYNEITQITGVKNKATIKSFLEFVPDEEIGKNILDEVFHIKENANNIIPIRQRIGDTKRIYNFEIVEPKSNNLDVLQFALTPEEAFGSIKQLLEIDVDSLSPEELVFYKDEFAYLSLLEEIKTYSIFDRKDILNDLVLRLKLLDKHIFNHQEEPLKEFIKTLKVA